MAARDWVSVVDGGLGFDDVRERMSEKENENKK